LKEVTSKKSIGKGKGGENAGGEERKEAKSAQLKKDNLIQRESLELKKERKRVCDKKGEKLKTMAKNRRIQKRGVENLGYNFGEQNLRPGGKGESTGSQPKKKPKAPKKTLVAGDKQKKSCFNNNKGQGKNWGE